MDKNNLKIGSKVLLYKLRECKKQPWYGPDDDPWDLFYVKEEGYEESVGKEMGNFLGKEVTILDLDKNHFLIREDKKRWYWPYQLIKEILDNNDKT